MKKTIINGQHTQTAKYFLKANTQKSKESFNINSYKPSLTSGLKASEELKLFK